MGLNKVVVDQKSELKEIFARLAEVESILENIIRLIEDLYEMPNR
jgi:hypothetical protein